MLIAEQSRAEQSRGIVLPICHSHNSLKIVIKGASCPFFHGRDAPFCVLRQMKNKIMQLKG